MLTASHLTRRFDGRVAVENLSLQLAPGEIFALLGPNGAGKTTTLRMLAGLIAPTSGEVRFDDRVMTTEAAALRSRIGFLTEAPGLWDRLSVRDNLLVYARLHDLRAPSAAVERAMEMFDISDRASEPTAQLSKGLKQRVALARTLLHDPAVVLLDEPTAGLDPESAHDTRALIQRLRHEQRTVVLSTHNLDEVERVADRVGVLRTTLIALDTPAALRARVFRPRVRVTLTTAAAAFESAARAAGATDIRVDDRTMSIALDQEQVVTPRLVDALVRAGAGVMSVIPEQPPLEEVYLHLVKGETP